MRMIASCSIATRTTVTSGPSITIRPARRLAELTVSVSKSLLRPFELLLGCALMDSGECGQDKSLGLTGRQRLDEQPAIAVAKGYVDRSDTEIGERSPNEAPRLVRAPFCRKQVHAALT
jgi:hypothetical protein